MGYDARVYGSGTFKEGVTKDEAYAAFEQLTDYVHGLVRSGSLTITPSGDQFEFSLNYCGEVGYGFFDEVESVAENLRDLVDEAGSFELCNDSTGDPDERTNTIYFGNERAIRQLKFDEALAGLGVDLDGFVPADVLIEVAARLREAYLQEVPVVTAPAPV